MIPDDRIETVPEVTFFAVTPPPETMDELLRRVAEDAADDRPFRRGRPQQHVSQRLRAARPV